MPGQYTAQFHEDKIMAYWHRYRRADLMGWKVTRILDPSKVHQKDVIWLDTEPSNLDPTKMFYIELDPALVPPITFTQNLPGNNATDAGATYIPLGSNKTFTVAVTGGVPPYTYAWFRRASSTDNPVGTNSPTYTITGYAAGNNGDYFCRVTDSAGQTVESLRERTKPAIALSTNLPATDTWIVGTADSLAIVVNTATGLAPYTYQWQKSTNGGTSWSNVTNGGAGGITGATSATLNVATPQTADAGQYRCIATSSNTVAPNTVTSAVCTVTVNAA